MTVEYVMFIATDPEAEPYVAEEDDIAQWVARGVERGQLVKGDRLRGIEDATTVRMRDGELLVTDGPFTESREWIAGYDIIDVADLDEAIALAGSHPMARFGRIEIRPVWPLDL
jgi:hypothetical protein